MAKKIKEWSKGSISIVVESGKDDMNKEGIHVHIYKRNRRTNSRIPGSNKDLDRQDFETAEDLYERNYSEIRSLCQDVKDGKYDA